MGRQRAGRVKRQRQQDIPGYRRSNRELAESNMHTQRYTASSHCRDLYSHYRCRVVAWYIKLGEKSKRIEKTKKKKEEERKANAKWREEEEGWMDV